MVIMKATKIILVNATGIDLTFRGFTDNMVTPEDIRLKFDMFVRPAQYENVEPYTVSNIKVPATIVCDKWDDDCRDILFMVNMGHFKHLQDNKRHTENLAQPVFIGNYKGSSAYPFNAVQFVGGHTSILYNANGNWYICKTS